MVATHSLTTEQVSPIIPQETSLATSLKTASTYQNSGIGTFNNVTTWRQFVQLKTLCERNWSQGRHQLRIIYYGRPVWRFKVDTPKQLLVIVTAFGVIRSTSLLADPAERFHTDFNPIWYHQAPGWSHIELTSVPVSAYINSNWMLILTTDGHIIYPDRREHLQIHKVREDNTGIDHVRSIQFKNGQSLRYLKARWPLLVAGNTTYIGIWDLPTGSLVQEIQIDPPQQVFYVELSRDFVFLCCEDGYVIAFSRQTGREAYRLPGEATCPQSSPDEVFEQCVNFSEESSTQQREDIDQGDDASFSEATPSSFAAWPPVGWPGRSSAGAVVGMHLDPSTGVAVAIFNSGIIMICGCYDNPSRAQEALVFAWMPGFDFREVCVENGRAAIVCCGNESEPAQTLMALSFQRFTSVQEFMTRKTATIQIVDPVMPTRAPVSRLEMDSTAIYVTGTVLNGHRGQSRRAVNEWRSKGFFHDQRWHWRGPRSEKVLIPLTVTSESGPVTKALHRRSTDAPDDIHFTIPEVNPNPNTVCDSILVYRFDQEM